eukprot:m.435107 g.435107  ORF g.435107 m.435107 type:complete len:662 (+) comp17813_c0_seq1:164-2149(+)
MDSNDDQQATTNGGTETAPELPRTESYADAVIVSDVLDANPEAKGEDTTTDKSDVSGSEKLMSGTEHADTQGDVAVAMPGPPPFNFWALLNRIHKMIVKLKGYPLFVVKFVVMQLVRVSSALGFVVAAYVIGDDFDINDISRTQYAVFGALGALYVLGSMVPFMGNIAIDRLKESLQIDLATQVVAKIFEMQYDSMVSTPTGEFVQLISKVFMNLDKLLPALYGAIVPIMFEVFVAIIIIGALYGPICLMQLGLFVIYSVIAFKSAAKKARRNKEVMMVMFSEWGKIMDTATAYERAHFFGNVDYEVTRVKGSFERIGVKMSSLTLREHLEGMTLSFLSLTVTVVFILILPVALDDDIATIELAALALYFLIFIGNMSAYATGISNLRAAVQEYQAFDEYVARKSGIEDIEGAIDIGVDKNPTIEFKDVSFSYSGKQILNQVSFKVNGGETMGLVGSSGCGKSTIMRLLLRFYRPTSGTITINGRDITKVTGSSLRRLFSVMPQNAELFNLSIRDNIAYGKMGSSDDEIVEAAKLAELPLGTTDNDLTLDKICGEKGGKLSGGQQQRVALARAMLKNGTIYLLDEPTTALDGVVAQQLQRTLDTLCTHATTIFITHHLNDLKTAHQIVYLKDGSVLESGTYDELVAQGGAFAEQVDARAQG